MDPFVVISFGKKIFRTRVIRHSLNPTWDEKLLFHVRRYETSFNVQLTLLDWDKLTSNDHIGDVTFNVRELVDSAPQPLENGLYKVEDIAGIEESSMKEFKLPLTLGKDISWDATNVPMVSFRCVPFSSRVCLTDNCNRAKYQPYDAIRQQFWRRYVMQYNVDGSSALSHLEITSMLDSLGSTLSSSTISSFFTRFGKKAHEEEMSVDEVILCLEDELNKSEDQKRRLDSDDLEFSSSVSMTPILQVANQSGNVLELDELDFSGPAILHGGISDDQADSIIPAPAGTRTEPMQIPLHQVATPIASASPVDSSSEDMEEDFLPSSLSPTFSPRNPGKTKKRRFRGKGRAVKTRVVRSATGLSSGNASPSYSGSEDQYDGVERVINVKNCPLCHRPRMNSKAEVDIITHIAVCASQDWNRVDRIVVGNFVTASQAQRKWYTKIIGKLSSGNYKLGAVSIDCSLLHQRRRLFYHRTRRILLSRTD